MDNGGREALLHHLLSRDLKSFNIRLVPKTQALEEQEAYSRRGLDRLIETLCHDGVLPSAHFDYPNIAITSGEAKGEGFYAAARTLVPDFKYESSVVINSGLKRDWECVPWKRGYLRGMQFPSLARLRELFDEKHGSQEWTASSGETDCWSST